MMKSNLQNPAIECCHIKAATNATSAEIVELREERLSHLVSVKLISEKTKQRCLKMSLACRQSMIPLVVHANFDAKLYKDRMMYFSVFSESEHYFSKFRRVRVTFDSEDGVWSCKCPKSGERSMCDHEILAKWYIAQTDPSKMVVGGRR